MLQYPPKDLTLQTFLIFKSQKPGSKFLHKVCRICPNCSKGPAKEYQLVSLLQAPSTIILTPNPTDHPHPPPTSTTNYLQNLPFRESPALYSEPVPRTNFSGPFLLKAAASGLRLPPLYGGETSYDNTCNMIWNDRMHDSCP